MANPCQKDAIGPKGMPKGTPSGPKGVKSGSRLGCENTPEHRTRRTRTRQNTAPQNTAVFCCVPWDLCSLRSAFCCVLAEHTENTNTAEHGSREHGCVHLVFWIPVFCCVLCDAVFLWNTRVFCCVLSGSVFSLCSVSCILCRTQQNTERRIV